VVTDTTSVRHEGVHDLFSRAAARFADQVAIDRVSQRITYRELEAQSNRLAQTLQRRGLIRGALVAIVTADPIAVTTGLLGVLKAGGVFVPLDPAFPLARLQALVTQVTPAWYVVDAASAARLSSLADPAAHVIRLDALADERAERPAVAWQANDPCSIYFTSGSTGRPKAILGRMSGLDHFARWSIATLGVGPDTRVSQLASPSFDGFLKDVFVPLCAGGVVCPPETRQVVLEPARLADWLDVEGIEILQCVPSVFRALLNERLDPAYFSALRWVVLAGEAVLPADVARWRAIFGDRVRLLNLYGPTETTITKFAYVIQPGDDERPSIPIGKPIPGAAAMILNRAGRPVPPSVAGEIYIRTPHRALGYFGDPELTRQAFVPNPFRPDSDDVVYRTGDFGRVLEDGTFEFLGRRDQQVKVRGVRVELGEIENALRRHPVVQDVAVVDRTDASGMTSLCAYVVLSEGTVPGALREYLAAQLPEFMVPSAFVPLAAMPRTLNGKVDRQALPPLEATRPADTSRPARTALEEIVAGIWSQVLRLPQVGRTEHFFELGGHSLLATQILARVREALGVELPLRTLFEAPTVEAFAAQVERARATAGAATLVPMRAVPRGDVLPLSYAQERMWFLEQLAEGHTSYHLPLGLQITGPLNVGLLDQTFGEVIRRHEVLRTHFPARGGEPRQTIAPPMRQRLALVDLRGLAAPAREREARRVAEADVRRPFDLAAGPLVRTVLLRLADETHVLVCTMHHLITDAWSFRVLTAEVHTLSARFAQGGPSTLPELPIQYADYAVWQRQWLQDEVLAERLAYWQRQLAGAPEHLALPQRKRRPAVPSHRGQRQAVAIVPEQIDALRALSRREGPTLYMTLLAAFSALLHEYTGQTDLVVGSVIANRERPEVEPLVGFFANTLVLRLDLTGPPTFRELLARVRETCLGAYAHQLPPETLVQALARGGTTSLYDVWFQLETADPEPASAGLPWERYELQRPDAIFELSLVLTETPDGVRGEMEYDADLFEDATIAQMIEDYAGAIGELVREPHQTI
jgi:amino acid adenylation domain-containing protein